MESDQQIKQQQPQYHLSQELFAHSNSVRCIDAREDLLISGSVDRTVNIFQYKPDKKLYEKIKDINMFDQYVYVVKIKSDGKGFIVGNQDSKIYIFDIDCNLDCTLEGHKGSISSLSQFNDDFLASGGWDGTARIWDLKSRKLVKTFEGHSFAVAVLAIPELDYLVVGSQNKQLTVYKLSTKQQVVVVKDAHEDIIRDIKFIKDFGFATCSNDCKVKLWTYQCEPISELIGHEAYVYSIDCCGTDLLISSSDDKTVKLWNNNNCIQTINHPGCIWQVCINKKSGDIITACSDTGVRVFSVDPSRVIDQLSLENFQQSCQVAALQSQEGGVSEKELSKLPPVDQLNQFQGKKDGEVKIFRNGTNAEAYVWKQMEKKWEKMGDVVDKPTKKFYEGDRYFPLGEYDYVFNVEDDFGQTKLLPYNEGDNPMEVSDKYCAREGISKRHSEPIRVFLKKNTRYELTKNLQKQQQKMMEEQQYQQLSNNQLNPNQQMEQQQLQQQQQQQQIQLIQQNPESKQQEKQQPQQQSQSNITYFPHYYYIHFENMNIQGLQKKVIEFNQILAQSKHAQALSPKEVKFFNETIDILGNPSQYYINKLEFYQFDVIKKLLQWPPSQMLPVYDLLRIFMFHQQSEQLFSGLDEGQEILLKIGNDLSSETNETLLNLLLKLLCNLTLKTASKRSLSKYYQYFINGLKVIVKKNTANQNLWSSFASLIVDLSIDINIRAKEMKEEYLADITNITLLKIKSETDPLNVLKLLSSLGNICLGMPTVTKPIIGPEIMNFVPVVTDEKIKQCLIDLKAAIQQK